MEISTHRNSPTSTWQNELRSSLKSFREINSFFNHEFPVTSYPVSIPLFIANKIKTLGLESKLSKQFLPIGDESCDKGLIDPIGDHTNSPVKQLVHRYKNRVLFFPTQTCPILCRYCFRKNELGVGDDLFNPNFEEVLRYLKIHPEIEEVIFSGGDPFILSNSKIEFYLEQFSKIKTIKYIRFHTRVPTTLPSRIDQSLINTLSKYSNIFKKIIIVIHANHAEEFCSEVESCIKKFSKENLELLSQSVLLKGINDSTKELKDLIEKLLDCNIRPYYLHHPDRVKGAMHFYLPLEEGRKIYGALRKDLSGWALPSYIIDIPGGEGKVNAFNPEQHTYNGQLLNQNGQKIPLAEHS
jgi:lysine 2,3-aminomutase